MLTIRDHNVEDYATLRDIDATNVDVLDEADGACLDQLGQFLVSTDGWRRFAIWLTADVRVREHDDPAKPGQKYSTTWFDMFRIEDGKIAEHWDVATK